jgi:hypothetical protein
VAVVGKRATHPVTRNTLRSKRREGKHQPDENKNKKKKKRRTRKEMQGRRKEQYNTWLFLASNAHTHTHTHCRNNRTGDAINPLSAPSP